MGWVEILSFIAFIAFSIVIVSIPSFIIGHIITLLLFRFCREPKRVFHIILRVITVIALLVLGREFYLIYAGIMPPRPTLDVVHGVAIIFYAIGAGIMRMAYFMTLYMFIATIISAVIRVLLVLYRRNGQEVSIMAIDKVLVVMLLLMTVFMVRQSIP